MAQAGNYTEKLFYLIESNDIAGIRLTIENNEIEINHIYKDKKKIADIARTPLIEAIKSVNPEMVKLFLEHGANVELKDGYDSTPLMSAILWADVTHASKNYSVLDKANSIEIVDMLINCHANVNYNGTYGGKPGVTPLGQAASVNDYSLSLILTGKLLNAGADVNPNIASDEMSPLLWALTTVYTRWEDEQNNRLDVIKMLLEAGANPNITYGGTTPLHIAAAIDYDLTKLLLNVGANKNAKNSENKTALDTAAKFFNLRIMALIALH
jgi:ankyrin repeat protein